MAYQQERACFVPQCSNNSTSNPDKLFVRIREDLKPEWCRQVNTECFKIYNMYCCEDHLNLEEDVKNYNAWKVFKIEPKLKPNAKLRSIPNKLLCPSTSKNVNIEDEKSCTMIPKPSDSSELKRLLLCPMENLTPEPKRRKLDQENIIPNTCGSTVTVKIHAATQCHVKMVDKSTNYRARKTFPTVKQSDELEPSPSITSSSPSVFGGTTTTETETTTAEESDQSRKKEFNIRKNCLELINKKPKMYLGLPLQFMWLIDHIILKSNIKTTYLCLVVTLFKIKQNDTLERMSNEFQLSRAKISTMFAQGVEVLANFFQNLIYMPSPIQIKKTLPLVFKIRFSNVQMIIDCFEIQIEKPTDPVKQAQTWSQYKNCNTIKYLIGSTPNGLINFISAGYGGRISDKALVIKSQLVDVLPHNAVVLADRGFKEVESLLVSKGITLLRPPSVFKDQKPSKAEVLQSKAIASLRVHIERVIRRVREFRLLKPHSVVNSKHVGYLDEIVIIACGLINLQSEIIKKY